jgi:hypothetical protein
MRTSRPVHRNPSSRTAAGVAFEHWRYVGRAAVGSLPNDLGALGEQAGDDERPDEVKDDGHEGGIRVERRDRRPPDVPVPPPETTAPAALNGS